MASSAKVLLIRYVDKAAFVVALGILGYVLASSFFMKKGGDIASQLKDIVSLQQRVEKNLRESKPDGKIEEIDLTIDLKKRFLQVPEAGEFRPYIFTEPAPRVYDKVVLRQGEKVTLTLDDVPRKWGLTDIGIAKIVKVDGKQIILLGLEPGTTSCKCLDVKGMSHEAPIVVLPPKQKVELEKVTDLKCETELGKVILHWGPAKVKTGDVKSVKYEVFRRREGEKSGEFTKRVEVDATEWEDTEVKSGEVYFYKVRPVAITEDGPMEGDFCDPVEVTAKSSVEFNLVSVLSGSALFEVRAFVNGAWEKHNFIVARGGVIGQKVIPSMGQEPIQFSTGCVLVDVFLNARRLEKRTYKERKFKPGVGFVEVEVTKTVVVRTSKAIYEGRKGVPKVAWQQKPSEIAPTPKPKSAAPAPAKKEPEKAGGGGAAILQPAD